MVHPAPPSPNNSATETLKTRLRRFFSFSFGSIIPRSKYERRDMDIFDLRDNSKRVISLSNLDRLSAVMVVPPQASGPHLAKGPPLGSGESWRRPAPCLPEDPGSARSPASPDIAGSIQFPDLPSPDSCGFLQIVF